MITASLIANGIDPDKVFLILTEYVSIRVAEKEQMERNGIKVTRKSRRLMDYALRILDDLMDEQCESPGEPPARNITGLN